jgi:hypothetical protein
VLSLVFILHTVGCHLHVTVIESPTGDCEPLYNAAVKAAAEGTAAAATATAAAAATMDEIEEQQAAYYWHTNQ